MEALARLEQNLWRLLLLLAPISASPLLPLGSGTLARPLAAAPAFALLLLAGFRFLFLGQRPRLALSDFSLLILFALYTILSGLAVVSVNAPDVFKGQTPLDSLLRAEVTFAVGVMFYTVAKLRIRSDADIRVAFHYLFIGMAASIGFAGIQVLAMVAHGAPLRAVQALTDLIAVHYDGLVSRAQGFTFEPSWLAAQIIVLLMPLLIAQSLSGEEFVGIKAQHGFVLRLVAGFGLAISGLLFSGSRFGLVCIVAMLILSGLLAMRRGRFTTTLIFIAVLTAGAAGVVVMNQLGAGAGASYVTGPIAYLTGEADLDTSQDVAADVTDSLALAGRVAVAQASAGMWWDHPLLGVSLGNNYRYFGDYAPDWAFATQLFTQGAQEGVGWLDPSSPEKGNAKNMYLRLLSETGLLGFGLFVLFVLRQIFFGPARDNFHANFRLATLMAIGFGFLNQDTLVDPSVWIPLALCAAMNLRSLPGPIEPEGIFAAAQPSI